MPERCILEALLRRVLYCGYSTQYSHLVLIFRHYFVDLELMDVCCVGGMLGVNGDAGAAVGLECVGME